MFSAADRCPLHVQGQPRRILPHREARVAAVSGIAAAFAPVRVTDSDSQARPALRVNRNTHFTDVT